jgi:beta-glucanase (GH16 family)
MLRKPLAVLVGLFMAAGLTVAVSGSTAAEAAAPGLKRSPAKPWPGEVTKLSGRIAPKGRIVALQEYQAGRWVQVKRARTAAGGAYSLTVRATPTHVKYRVVAPKTKIAGKNRRQVVSASRTVVAKAPQVRVGFAGNPIVAKNGRAYLSGRVVASPANSKARATVQRLTANGWRNVASGSLVKGSYRFRVVANKYRYRALVRASGSTSSWTVSKQNTPTWRVSWRDEFTNDAASRKTWDHRDLGSRYGRRICSTTGARQTTYPGGVMRLRLSNDARPKQDPHGTKVKNWAKACPNGTYLNAMVGTQLTKNFKHGVFAARVKFQAPQGMHGAFWLQSNGTPEIDVAEYFGNGRADGGLASYLHSKPNAKGKMTSVGGVLKSADKIVNRGSGTAASRYHVYSVEWTKAGYVFRIDGKVTLRSKRLRSTDPHFMVLSLISSDWEMSQLKKSQLSKAYVDVDWVRAWQK